MLNLDTAAATERAAILLRQHDGELIEMQHGVHRNEAQLIQNFQLSTELLKSLLEADTVNLQPQGTGTAGAVQK